MSKRKSRNAKKKAETVTLTPQDVILARRRRLADQTEVRSFFVRLFSLAALTWFLFHFVFGITPMANDDMLPRISAGDLLIYYRLENTWHAQDVIVFEKEGKQYIGRIVAQGGDSVEVTEDARLIINGSYVVESDIYYSTPRYDSDVVYPLQLEQDQFFVLCDYRPGAKDSRYFGAVDLREIKGKVITAVRRSGL